MKMRKLFLIASVILASVQGQALRAQDDEDQAAPPPFPEFSFRRIGVPQPGQSGPRINIHIGDQPGGQVLSTTEPEPRTEARQSSDWFWEAIPAGLDDGEGRFAEAMRLLASAPEAADLPVASTGTLLSLIEAHGTRILRETIGTRVSPALVLAVMAVESHGDEAALSDAGAQGLMQLIPATAVRFGVADAFDADQNISGGIAYLDWLMDEFDRDPVMVLAAYNAGEGAVRSAGGVPEFPETRDYVPRVLATWATARSLCLTPPELVSDGCVFRTMTVPEG